MSGSTPEVAYAYENGSSGNTARRKSMIYPNGRIIDIGYGAVNSADDLLSRIASLKVNGECTNLVDYTYFGLTAIAKVSYPEPAVNLSYIKTASQPVGDAGDPYTGYDRFGRTVDMRWVTSSGGAVRDRFQYGYDRASQRTWKSNLAASAGDGQDEHYSYDGLYQVTEAARGELNINRSAIGGIPAKEEGFSYDPTGNWDQYVEKSDGTTDLDQTRKNNKDNQITQFDGSSENVEHDKAGNATKMLPDKTGDWSKYYQLKWDAWNRLVEVKDSASAVVATYAYDGTTRRITKTIGGVVRHYYYNDQWKAVEERLDAATTAERQYAWGIQFRNDLILRDRDTNGNGTLDERLYATHDALGNCTAILNTSGAAQERYGYSAFGVRRIMQADFSLRASSSFAWDFGFQGEFLDDETGYINYGYRYYLPYIGKWINRDPIEEEGGMNLYWFVGNDGVNLVDFIGLATITDSTNEVDPNLGAPAGGVYQGGRPAPRGAPFDPNGQMGENPNDTNPAGTSASATIVMTYPSTSCTGSATITLTLNANGNWMTQAHMNAPVPVRPQLPQYPPLSATHTTGLPPGVQGPEHQTPNPLSPYSGPRADPTNPQPGGTRSTSRTVSLGSCDKACCDVSISGKLTITDGSAPTSLIGNYSIELSGKTTDCKVGTDSSSVDVSFQ